MKERLGRLFARFAAWARSVLVWLREHPALALVALTVAVPCCTLFSVEVRSLRGALYGIHEWRQGWTYSVAYAFVHEDASFFFPKHAWRGHLSGIIGMEPPIYPYVVSLFMRVFGDTPVIGRVLNFALFALALGLWMRRLGQLYGFSTALGCLVVAALSPVALCEFRQFQPDPAMTSLSMIAAVMFHDHGRTGARRSFLLGLAIYTVALLTKPIAVAIMPAMFLFAVLGEARPSLRGAVVRLAAFALPLALMVAWDKWSNVLVQRYMEGRPIISIDHEPALMWAQLKDVAARRYILLGLLENYVTHVALFPAVLFGVPLALTSERRSWALPLLCWFAGVAVIALAFSARYYTNWYYMLLFMPPVLFFGATGLSSLFDTVGMRARGPEQRAAALGVVLAALLVMPLLDDLPWDRIEHLQHQLAVHVRRHVSMDNVQYWLATALSFVAALSYFALRDRLERVPNPLYAGAFALGSGVSMVVPYKDTLQTVRFYTTEPDWDRGHVDSKEIQRAVDKYSTSKDLFVMNGANPALLARALRVGWADEPGVIDQLGREFFVKHGGRFFMQFSDSPPIPTSMHGLPLLERGERWELYCMDPNGCPPRRSRRKR